ncbi:MAG TPA: hypothetical protein VK611_30735 [Acidimicrobiales bacterium]|nr:hypothetical protein [Acidimicrobiales bacterium]
MGLAQEVRPRSTPGVGRGPTGLRPAVRGREPDAAAVEQRFRRVAATGTVGITIGALVGLLVDLFLFE